MHIFSAYLFLYLAVVCTSDALFDINPPTFLITSTTSNDVVVDGQYIRYVCRNTSLVVPEQFDQDRNLAIDIICRNGTYKLPKNWPPTDCIEYYDWDELTKPPEYTKLIRVKTENKTRPHDLEYFTCESPEMVLKPSGSNMFSSTADKLQQSDMIWPNCTEEPVCNEIPTPSNESLLVNANQVNEVKVGEFVTYECRNKEEFFSTPDEVNIFKRIFGEKLNNKRFNLYDIPLKTFGKIFLRFLIF